MAAAMNVCMLPWISGMLRYHAMQVSQAWVRPLLIVLVPGRARELVALTHGCETLGTCGRHGGPPGPPSSGR